MSAAAVTSRQADRSAAPRGGVVAAHELAARAGAQILESGGNAADAAAGVAAVLGVVDPANCGIGGYGGLAVVMDDARGGAMQVDFNAVVPGGFAAMPTSDASGALVSPPAVVSGLCALQARFGRLGAADVWAPAIRIAREGFPVGPDLAAAFRWAVGKHRGLNGAFRSAFLPDGEPPREGQLLRQARLAETLEQVAAHGNGALASGAIAESICATVREAGGCLVPADLAGLDARVAPADRAALRRRAGLGAGSRAMRGEHPLRRAGRAAGRDARRCARRALHRGAHPRAHQRMARAQRALPAAGPRGGADHAPVRGRSRRDARLDDVHARPDLVRLGPPRRGHRDHPQYRRAHLRAPRIRRRAGRPAAPDPGRHAPGRADLRAGHAGRNAHTGHRAAGDRRSRALRDCAGAGPGGRARIGRCAGGRAMPRPRSPRAFRSWGCARFARASISAPRAGSRAPRREWSPCWIRDFRELVHTCIDGAARAG